MAQSFCKAVGIQRKYISKVCMQEQKRRKDCLNEDVEKSIKEFFQQDNVSTNIPNKKCIKKDMQEKRVLQTSLEAAWNKWKEENPDKSVSYDKFCKLKPKTIQNQSHRKLFQWLCEYCENCGLKLETINLLAGKNKTPELKLKNIYKPNKPNIYTLSMTAMPSTPSCTKSSVIWRIEEG